ncbi:hypothetical protein ACO0RG_002647 [Hanseniaspora osmophila]
MSSDQQEKLEMASKNNSSSKKSNLESLQKDGYDKKFVLPPIKNLFKDNDTIDYENKNVIGNGDSIATNDINIVTNTDSNTSTNNDAVGFVENSAPKLGTELLKSDSDMFSAIKDDAQIQMNGQKDLVDSGKNVVFDSLGPNFSSKIKLPSLNDFYYPPSTPNNVNSSTSHMKNTTIINNQNNFTLTPNRIMPPLRNNAYNPSNNHSNNNDNNNNNNNRSNNDNNDNNSNNNGNNNHHHHHNHNNNTQLYYYNYATMDMSHKELKPTNDMELNKMKNDSEIESRPISSRDSNNSQVIQPNTKFENMKLRLLNSRDLMNGLDSNSLNNPLNNPLNIPLNNPLNNPLNIPLNNPLNNTLNNSIIETSHRETGNLPLLQHELNNNERLFSSSSKLHPLHFTSSSSGTSAGNSTENSSDNGNGGGSIGGLSRKINKIVNKKNTKNAAQGFSDDIMGAQIIQNMRTTLYNRPLPNIFSSSPPNSSSVATRTDTNKNDSVPYSRKHNKHHDSNIKNNYSTANSGMNSNVMTLLNAATILKNDQTDETNSNTENEDQDSQYDNNYENTMGIVNDYSTYNEEEKEKEKEEEEEEEDDDVKEGHLKLNHNSEEDYGVSIVDYIANGKTNANEMKLKYQSSSKKPTNKLLISKPKKVTKRKQKLPKKFVIVREGSTSSDNDEINDKINNSNHLVQQTKNYSAETNHLSFSPTSSSQASDEKPKSKSSKLKSQGQGIRSRKGCWICRLRKKKCTEERPVCENCARLNLECLYDDDTKPDFISDPELKEKKLKQIRKRTKEAKRQSMSVKLKKRYWEKVESAKDKQPTQQKPLQLADITASSLPLTTAPLSSTQGLNAPTPTNLSASALKSIPRSSNTNLIHDRTGPQEKTPPVLPPIIKLSKKVSPATMNSKQASPMHQAETKT